ncbi:hypothetical protein C8R47DRAFT_960183 [Mycena vitilis]|nr:hypothetical protein C8R47DRAFT_960183 [Mycena vitilis]
MASEARFSFDIEREIFETTALMYYNTIPSLLLVARRVNLWIEPLLYRIVVAHHWRSETMRALVNAMASKPPEFFHNAVRHFALSGAANVSFGEAKELLRRCTGLVDFGASRHFTDPGLLRVLAELPVHRLSLSLGALFGGLEYVNPTHAVFRCVTHIDLFDMMDEGLLEIVPLIPQLPALTHLCLDDHTPQFILTSLLTQCPRLEILLVLYPLFQTHAYEAARVPEEHDVRLVIGQYQNSWEDWEDGAKGLPYPWSRADDFVARKQRGEIESVSFDSLCALMTH